MSLQADPSKPHFLVESNHLPHYFNSLATCLFLWLRADLLVKGKRAGSAAPTANRCSGYLLLLKHQQAVLIPAAQKDLSIDLKVLGMSNLFLKVGFTSLAGRINQSCLLNY